MRYKVYDTVRKCFVADDQYIVLKPDGRLAVNEYGDEIGIPRRLGYLNKERCV